MVKWEKGRIKMKILSMAWNIYDDRIKNFKKNCTGGGLGNKKPM